MKLSVTFLECADGAPFFEDTLSVERKLNEGKYQVFEVYSPVNNASYALKVFPKTAFDTLKYHQEQLFSSLSHPNIIQSVPVQCDQPTFHIHMTELAKFGDFLALMQGGLLSYSESIARTFFHHLIEGLEYIHSQGFAHLDLKLENIILGSDFLLKIIDFDQAQLLSDERMTSAGTFAYRAPEIVKKTCKDLAAADIYSAGIILYALKTGEIPFLEVEDEQGETMIERSEFLEDNAGFWANKAESFGDKNLFGSELIELLNGMLQEDPARRMTIEDIKESVWYKKNVLSPESMKIRMKAAWANAQMKKSLSNSSK